MLQVKERIKPRQLREGQRILLIDALKRSPIKGPIEINVAGGDNETIAFAAQLTQAFEAAGWEPGGAQMALQENPAGLFLLVRSADALPPRAVAIAEAFNAAGIPFFGQEQPHRAEDEVAILVGVKPQP